MANGRLNLTVLDVYGDHITERVDIFLRNQILSQTFALRDRDVTKTLVIGGLEAGPNGRYKVEIDSMSYRAVALFKNIPASGSAELTVTLPVNPKKVIRVEFPAYGSQKIAADAWQLLEDSTIVDSGGTARSGEALYKSLGDIPKAGFLNLAAKADRTRFTGQTGTPRSALSYVQKVTELRGDRFFAQVDAALRSETIKGWQEGLFNEADEILHTPPVGYKKDRSFKTLDHYGNLQLSFFSGAIASNLGQYALDMDIDSAQGFEHLFQVLENIGGATHPYNIHEILIAAQELDPGYDLILREAPAKKAKASRRRAK